ncbi:MAG: DUF5060 domain-containing protein [Anaerolineae bacterium]|nr:DUF5060 domain-containing protein [Anaerolineae bacterium]
MRLLRFTAICIFAAAALLPLTWTHGQEAQSELVGELYSPLTFPVEVDPASYTNPFDPADIEVLGIFSSPTGKQYVIPGFWMQPYENQCADPCSAENLQPSGSPGWQVRFTPTEIGSWSYTIQVQDGGAVKPAGEGQFTVQPSTRAGFVRVGANNHYFRFDNGQPFFPIGHSIKWSWDDVGGVSAYQEWLRQLSADGGNYARLYIDTPWFIGLEWKAPAGDYTEAQKAAARLDIILQTAAEYGIELQLVLLWHQALTIYGGPPVLIPNTFDRPDTSADWDNNPYNITYGGPIGGPSIFFFNDRAQELFRRRLHYIVARWGYSPQIFAWEIIDRLDRTGDYDPQTTDQWLTNTASYLKQIDQQHHLVTASTLNFDPVISTSPLLDFTSGEFYQSRPLETIADQVTGAVNIIQQNLQSNPAPHLMVDYSLNPWYEPTGDDPEGIHFQTTLWAAALSGSAGGAAADWWYSYLIPQNLGRYYAPLAAFATGIDWSNLDLQSAQAGLLIADSASAPVRINTFNRFFSAAPLDIVVPHTITADGIFPTVDNVPSFLYGQVYNSQFSQAQIYRVTPSAASYLEVRVRRVSTQAGARLVISVDNQVAASTDMSAGSTNISIRLPLPAGEHEIVLDNLGDDWLELDYIEIGNLIAPVRAFTLRDSTTGIALAWLQNRAYTWENAAGVGLIPISLQYNLGHMPSGLYTIETWDPLSGNVLGEDMVRVGDNKQLQIALLPFTQELALRIFRRGESSPVPTLSPPTSTVTPAPQPTASPTEALFPTNTPRP